LRNIEVLTNPQPVTGGLGEGGNGEQEDVKTPFGRGNLAAGEGIWQRTFWTRGLA
jgi:hypothetical protein